MTVHGYMGKLLFVDLTDNTYQELALPENDYREYIGGYGLGVRFLYENVKPGLDPLGPDNTIGFVTGPLVGTKCHGAGRFTVVSKSPLTGGWGDANCGGKFGPALKRTGYDGIFITGRSERPVYLLITDQKVEVRDAGHLWGRDSVEAENIIKEEAGSNLKVASIGQAGESLSRIAGIMHDHGRAAGRSGLGAVMGSKNLKAVAVEGAQKVPVAHESGLDQVVEKMREDFKNLPRDVKKWTKIGTPMVYDLDVSIGDAPVQNWKGLYQEVYPLERAAKIGSDVYNRYLKRRYGCAQCSMICGAILNYIDSEGNLLVTHRPEYETIAAFGSNCLIDDIETIIKANELCNRYGFDTISAGSTIAFAMECYEKGLLTQKDTGGLDLNWGNKECILPLLEMMCRREGIGSLLADGVKVAAEKIGGEAGEFAIHVGGQEPAMHDPRCWPGFGYGYVLDPTPGRHTQGGVGFIEHGWFETELKQYKPDELAAVRYNYDSKGKVLADLNNWFHMFTSTGICLFAKFLYNDYPLLEALRQVTGWDTFDLNEALTTGERINTLRHCFNLREGLEPNDFNLPRRVMGQPPFPSGPTAGVTIDIETVRESYYKELGWDVATGRPSEKKLKALNLSSLVTDLP